MADYRWQDYLREAPANCEAEGRRFASRSRSPETARRVMGHFTRKAQRLREVYAIGHPAPMRALADAFDAGAAGMRRKHDQLPAGARLRRGGLGEYLRAIISRHEETALYLRLAADALSRPIPGDSRSVSSDFGDISGVPWEAEPANSGSDSPDRGN